MTRLLVIIMSLMIVGGAAATELGNHRLEVKSPSHVGQNPGTPDGREGGETMETAVPIASLPFYDTGNTSDNINDYDPMCPYDGSTSPDVVYSYVPAVDEMISVDLCGSTYDTNCAIYNDSFQIVACNDDYYYDDPDCMNYVSFIEVAELSAGETYFIVVDGYGGDSGDYVLNVQYVLPPDPCDLTCDGVEEGEPTLGDGYVDAYNSGCGGSDPYGMMQELPGDSSGELVFCGKSGWFISGDGFESRDTDWFLAVIGSTGTIEWTLDAEQETYGFLLGPQDCNAVGAIDIMTAGPCAPATMTITGEPGDVVWLWTGPTEFTGPYGFEGHEFGYVSTFTGLQEGPVATESSTFGGIKSLYR